MDDLIQEKYIQAGRIAKDALLRGLSLIDEHVPYLLVAEEIEGYIRKYAGIAFPVNISVNEVAAHYTPSVNDSRVFHVGDVVKVDVGAHVDGYIGDTAKTIEVGANRYRGVIESSERALQNGLKVIKGNVSVMEVGGTIERSIKGDQLSPVDNLNGHQLEQYVLHAGVSIPNIGGKNGRRLKAGDAVAIEPFVTQGQGHVKNSANGNIYQLATRGVSRFPRVRDIYTMMKHRFGFLPFAGRWLKDFVPEGKVALTLARLQRRRLVTPYKTLVEISGHIVAQTEHTVLVTDTGCIITTQ